MFFLLLNYYYLLKVELREMAGCSMTAYDQNAIESMNASLKHGESAMSRSPFVDHITNYFRKQDQESEVAIRNGGAYRLISQYEFLKTDEAVFQSKSEKAKS